MRYDTASGIKGVATWQIFASRRTEDCCYDTASGIKGVATAVKTRVPDPGNCYDTESGIKGVATLRKIKGSDFVIRSYDTASGIKGVATGYTLTDAVLAYNSYDTASGIKGVATRIKVVKLKNLNVTIPQAALRALQRDHGYRFRASGCRYDTASGIKGVATMLSSGVWCSGSWLRYRKRH